MAETKIKRSWFQAFKSELKRVIWPTRKQTIKNTLAVIFLVAIISIIVIVLDFVFIKGNDFVIDKVTGGKVTAVKEEQIKEQNKITALLEEIKQYVGADEYTKGNYEQIGSVFGSSYLEMMLEEIKNRPVEDTSSEVSEPVEPTENTEGSETIVE